MPILKPTFEKKTHVLRANIDKELADKINMYLEYASIKKVDDFIEQAVEYVFKKDKEFNRYIKEKNRKKDIKTTETTSNLSADEKQQWGGFGGYFVA